MNDNELWNAIDGLMAYDAGMIDSGIKDEKMRQQVKRHLEALSDDEQRILVGRLARLHLLSNDALAKGHGIDDIVALDKWLFELLF